MAKTLPKFPLHDIHLSAYLAYRGYPPELEISGTHVTFYFPASAEVEKIAKEYNKNAPVPVIDYCNHLRRLRSAMLSLRNQGGSR